MVRSLASLAILIGSLPALAAPPAASASEVDEAPGERTGEAIFSTTEGLTPAGQVVAEWWRRARFHGLDTAPLDAEELERLLHRQLEILVAELPPRPRAHGILKEPGTRYYPSPDILWRNAPRPVASPEALNTALEAARAGRLEAHLTSLLPPHPQYHRLVDAAERYAALCEAGGFPEVPRPAARRGEPRRPKFRTPSAGYARALEARLVAEGFLASEDATGTWSESAQAAFSRWLTSRQLPQPRGLFMDELHRALAVPCDALVATLIRNVKRWRHSAWTGEETFVEVNIASQELRYVRNDELVMSQRAVVGSTHWYFDKELQRRFNVRSTPVMSHQISRIVINPTWSVPPRIAQRTIEKELAKDPDYLVKHRIKVVTSRRGTTYIQDPGEDNALGVIKILFPNEDAIYLHDTPKKDAFRLAVRALSNGCVRVQNALDLGLSLLEADAGEGGRPIEAQRLRWRAGKGGPIIFDLARTVPVFLEYYTASVDDAGLVRFHADVYAFDAALAR